VTPCLAGLNILGLPLSTLPLGWLALLLFFQRRARTRHGGPAAGCFFSSRVRIELSHRIETCFAAGGGTPRGRGLDLVNLVNLTRLDSRAVARPPAPPAALHLVRSAQRWPVATTL
jgi:hypothetical protein